MDTNDELHLKAENLFIELEGLYKSAQLDWLELAKAGDDQDKIAGLRKHLEWVYQELPGLRRKYEEVLELIAKQRG